jgi:putative RecB family exonuclease
VWQRPAAWLAQGSAVHEAAEAWEKSLRQMPLDDAQNVFRESYETHINQMCEITPEFNSWFASGPYRGEADIERRYNIGLQHVETYFNYYAENPQEVIWINDNGTLGVELDFDIDLDGVHVRGFIDAIIQNGEDLIVRDLKTGNKPGDEFQLAVYALGINEQYNIQPNKLEYFMSKTGSTVSHPIEGWDKDRITTMFKTLENNIQEGLFPPNPSKANCGFCDVSDSCEYRWKG